MASGAGAAADPAVSGAAREAVTVTTSVITPFFGAYLAEAKVRVSDRVALLVSASHLTLEKNDWTTKTGTVGAGVSYYPQRQALRRWYLEASGEVMLSSWRYLPWRQVAPLGLGYSGIALVGYQFVWERGFVLDLAAGVVGLHFRGVQITRDDHSVATLGAFTQVYPAAKINVGWAF